MSTATSALELAIWYYERREFYTKQDKFDAAVALGEYKLFSSRQISAIIDLPHTYVAKLINKTDKTGGRFDPKALRPLLKVAQQQARGEVEAFAVKEALDAGVTKYLASRLTLVARTTLERRYAQAVTMGGGEA